MRIDAICGSIHKEEITRMLEFATDEAASLNCEISEVVWVPGSMEVPLALERVLPRDDIDAAIALGIIERGQTQHGLVMGQSVTRAIIDLQIKHNKPIGLGIIGPGAEVEHIESRLEPHARAAVSAVVTMQN